MNPIIYIDGKLADHLGRLGVTEAFQPMADNFDVTFDVLTHGESKHHKDHRFTFAPSSRKGIES